MADTLQRWFRTAPRPLKDALCTLYGWRLHRQRYGGSHPAHRRRVAEEERLSPAELERLSRARLRETLVRAAREVPYYRRLFRERGVDPEHLDLPGGLERIPLLDKATVRERTGEFLSRAVGRPLLVRETSGTTGSPLAVPVDLDSLRRHYAVYDRFRHWAGSALGRRRATFNGRVLWPAERRRPPFWVRDLTENNLFFSIYHLAPEVLPAYVRTLARWAPHEIHAYPSALTTVARFARAQGLRLPRPSTIITSAETLTASDRELLEQSFGCPVFDQYGNAEMTVFAGQCRAGGLHLDIGYGHVELVDPRTDASGNRTGEAVTTGFVNRAMPLIRYRLGDTLALAPERCSCGRPQPVLREVVGRTDDLLLLPDGRTVGRLDSVFKGLHGLDEVQIIQEAPDRIVLRVVAGERYDPVVEGRMLRSLADRLGSSVRIRVQLVDRIPRTERGKFRAVVRAVVEGTGPRPTRAGSAEGAIGRAD